MKPTILIVDDDPLLLSGIRRVLRFQPYKLFVANSAESAKEMFSRSPFDLVVTDQRMNRLSGTDLIEWLAEYFPDTVRIMLTGHADVNVLKAAINRGNVFRFLTKPCRDVELALAILDGLEAGVRMRCTSASGQDMGFVKK